MVYEKEFKQSYPTVKKTNPDILQGLREIAEFLNRSQMTISNWIRYNGLPATKTPDGRWLTHKTLILQWIYAGYLAESKARGWTTPESNPKVSDIKGDKDIVEELACIMEVNMSYEELKEYSDLKREQEERWGKKKRENIKYEKQAALLRDRERRDIRTKAGFTAEEVD